MLIRLLGPPEVRVGERVVDLGGAKQQCVLAVLAMEPGRVVSVDALIDRVWGDEPPEQARNLVQTYVARLRKALTAAGIDGAATLRFAHGGYRLDVPDDQVDVHRVRGLLAGPGTEASQGAEALRTARDAFRGQPLAGIEGEWARGTRDALDQQRAGVRRRLVEFRLLLGEHAEVLPELDELASDNPLDESLVGLRMLALYRCGRRADALAAYRDARERLVEELGDDPRPELNELHDRVLRRDPTLDVAGQPAATAAPATGAWAPRDDLPRDTADFIGRAQEVDWLVSTAGARPDVVTVLAIDGMAGVGKTALALKVARRLADTCPDGRLFLDLRAHGAGTAFDALAVLLRAAGVAEIDIPDSEPERSAAWRARLAGRRVLLVLEAATDAGQIRPLLPGAPGCVVIVTSRPRLSGLTGAQQLSLDPLPPTDARDMFDRLAGAAAAAQPGLSSEVAALCGYLPLAIELAAIRLRNRPSWNVEDLLRRLADSRRRLTELRAGELNLAAAFELSYRELPAELRRMFRCLGVHPGTDLDAGAAAALDGTDPATAEDALEDLVDQHLLRQPRAGRYQLHNLLRGYAEQLAEDPAPALARLLEHYLAAASASPSVQWLDEELDNLLATVEAADEHKAAWRLAFVLFDHLENRRRYGTGVRLYELGLAGARRHADVPGEVAMSRCAGVMRWRRGEHAAAEELLAGSGRLAADSGDPVAAAEASYHLGGLAIQTGRPRAAVERYLAALPVYRDQGDRRRLADTLNNVGVAHSATAGYPDAVRCLEEAREVWRSLGDMRGEAAALSNLADVRLAQGDHRRAMATLLPVLELTRAAGDTREELAARTNVGIIALAAGDAPAAAEQFGVAVALARELGDPYEEIGTLVDVAVARHDSGDQGPELDALLGEALAVAERIGATDEQARALTVLGQVAARRGHVEDARAQWRRALKLLESLGSAQADVVRSLLDGSGRQAGQVPEPRDRRG